MLDSLKNEFNNTNTTNGAKALKTTESYVLDLFSKGGSYRNRSDKDVETLVSKAYAEDPDLTMKTLFFIRDIREGLGERRFFRVAIKYLAKHNRDSVVENVNHISEFGRWDDILVLLDTDLKYIALTVIVTQLSVDTDPDNKYPSLLAKWLPSLNASSEETKRLARIIVKEMGFTPRQYRVMLSGLRKKIGIIETKITEGRYEDIEYDKIPSKAGMNYVDAFFRNDYKRYNEFLDAVSKGEKTVNASTLYPYEITKQCLGISENPYGWIRGRYLDLPEEKIKQLNNAWNNLEDYIDGDYENSIAVVDTSGSMTGDPIEVAVSLGIYLAERNKGMFHNHFLTFSNRPELQEVIGTNIVEKVRNVVKANWCQNTNIEAVFEKILNASIEGNVPKEEMVSKVYIISDMQFDYCAVGTSVNIFENMKKIYADEGYELPDIVFWNVNAFVDNTQFTKNKEGVQMVSGLSPSIFKYTLNSENITPYGLMMEVLESDRYKDIKA